MSNPECRAVIKIFIQKGLIATEITKHFAYVYGDSVPSYCTVAKWRAQFNNSTRAFEEVSRSGRPTTALTDESIRTVEELVICDRQKRVYDKLLKRPIDFFIGKWYRFGTIRLHSSIIDIETL